MIDRKALDELIQGHGYTDYKWIMAEDIVVDQWVRFKCIWGCDSYGKKGSCPPYTPSVEECRDFFAGYTHALIFHFSKILENPKDRYAFCREANTKLLKLERDIFLAGHRKTFLVFMDECRLCFECAGSRDACKNPEKSRPSPEGLAMDVCATVKKYNYPFKILTDYNEPMNRYAFIMVQ